MSMSRPTIFEAYDEEFSGIAEDIAAKVRGFTTYEEDAARQKQTMTLVEGLLLQARDLLKQMEIEVRSQPPAGRRALQGKVKSYKTTLATLERDAREARAQQERNELLGMGPGAPDIGSESLGQRQRLLDSNDGLARQNDTLTNARRVMADTEDTALEIQAELGRNRERIRSAHARVKDVTGLTDVARRLVHSMNKRETQQRVITYGTILLAIGVVAIIIWETTK